MLVVKLIVGGCILWLEFILGVCVHTNAVAANAQRVPAGNKTREFPKCGKSKSHMGAIFYCNVWQLLVASRAS